MNIKYLFITGGNGEIGKAIVEQFKLHHYQIIAPNSSEFDLSDLASTSHYLSTLNTKIDTFIHCAGFNEPKPFVSIAQSDFDKTMLINATSFYTIVNLLLNSNLLVNDGTILGISSIYGAIARSGRFSYSAAKHALLGMIKTLAIELGHRNIRVNGLSPGFVGTNMTYKNNSPEKINELIQKVPLKRLAKPIDIAKVAYFLCSQENTFITGQNIIADGGYTIGGFEA